MHRCSPENGLCYGLIGEFQQTAKSDRLLAVAEQLAMDQPPGIAELYDALTAQHGDRHAALHVVVECLRETVWQAIRSGSIPDQHAYLARLREHLDKA